MKNTEQDTLSSFASIPKSDSSDTERSGSNSACERIASPTIAKRRGGPRTKLGKERSSRNSLKHGIFSRVPILDDEQWEQCDSLLQGYRKYFRPEGIPENMRVDKLASLEWRY